MIHYDQVLPSLWVIFQNAFNPEAGILGAGSGAFIFTLTYGVQRGLFSNEAGQGSAPIAHSAAKTDEPVSEGSVALLEPFIDTLVICTITALVIIVTGAWQERVPTRIDLNNPNIAYLVQDDAGSYSRITAPGELRVDDGRVTRSSAAEPEFGIYNVGVERLYMDADQEITFTGRIFPDRSVAVASDGTENSGLFGSG